MNAPFSKEVFTEDHASVTAIKHRLIHNIQTLLPNVRVGTLEDQVESYTAYSADLTICAEACVDFLIAYAEIVKAIGSDESESYEPALRDAVRDWISDETSLSDDWADEVMTGEDE